MRIDRSFAAALLAAGTALLPAQAAATPSDALSASSTLPDGVRAMIDAAIASGDAGSIETVLRLARETHPEAGAEIDAIDTAHRTALAERKAREAEAERERLASAGMFDRWKGQVELGASRSTGNTDNLGLYGALAAEREGLDWRHKLIARADIQESSGVTTTERLLASWQPNYKFDDRLYAYGLTQYEYDRFLAYDSRTTLGGGIGYGVIASPTVQLDFEGGPALRYTDADGAAESGATVAARASVNFSWKITPTLELKQSSAFYHEPGDSSATALTSIDTKLIGDLKARLSYNVQYEANVPPGISQLDTLSRATLVYSF